MTTCLLTAKNASYTVILQAAEPPPIMVYTPPPSDENPRLYYKGMPDVVTLKALGKLTFRLVEVSEDETTCKYEEIE